jgi:MoaA/NifB/PqqE/SkfB family radical SAM enzyme
MQQSNYKSYLKTAAALFRNGVKFHIMKLVKAPSKPAVISLAITNRCTSHCIMCNIWKRTNELSDIKTMEMTEEQITGLLSRPLFSDLVELDITGGEPHLREDLVDIILGIGKLKKRFLPRLKSIIIASNGLMPKRILSNYRAILEGLKDTGIDLVSVSSLDGIGETHDLIRGTRGAFELAHSTIDGLFELRKEYPHFYTGIKTTILPYNLAMLGPILDFIREKGFFHIISPVLFTEGRFRNMDKSDELRLSPGDYEKVLAFYRDAGFTTSFFYSRVRDYLDRGHKKWTCTALYTYMFIDFDGEVYPCEMVSEPLGNIKNQAIEDIWHSSQARSWRTQLERADICATCHEPGAIRYSASKEGFAYLSFLLEHGRHKFNESFYEEGFSKYF